MARYTRKIQVITLEDIKKIVLKKGDVIKSIRVDISHFGSGIYINLEDGVNIHVDKTDLYNFIGIKDFYDNSEYGYCRIDCEYDGMLWFKKNYKFVLTYNEVEQFKLPKVIK